MDNNHKHNSVIDDLIDVRARNVSAELLDFVRPAARRSGFGCSNSGTVRFAVALSARMLERLVRKHAEPPDSGSVDAKSDQQGDRFADVDDAFQRAFGEQLVRARARQSGTAASQSPNGAQESERQDTPPEQPDQSEEQPTVPGKKLRLNWPGLEGMPRKFNFP